MTSRRQFLSVSAAGAACAAAGFAPRALAQLVGKATRMVVGFPPACRRRRRQAGRRPDEGLRRDDHRRQQAGCRRTHRPRERKERRGRRSHDGPHAGIDAGDLPARLPQAPLRPVPGLRARHDRVLVGFPPERGSRRPPATVKTLADFLQWCKANPKEASYGSSGAGSMPHFTGVMLARAAGVPLTHVAYKGAAPAMQDLLGGQIAANISVLSNALPHVQSGKLRALATSGPRSARRSCRTSRR